MDIIITGNGARVFLNQQDIDSDLTVQIEGDDARVLVEPAEHDIVLVDPNTIDAEVEIIEPSTQGEDCNHGACVEAPTDREVLMRLMQKVADQNKGNAVYTYEAKFDADRDVSAVEFVEGKRTGEVIFLFDASGSITDFLVVPKE
jgi:hypothetical protein